MFLRRVTVEIKSHIVIYLLLTLVLVLAFFVRVYRLDQLLGFYFDQGRDALVIWKLWHEGKLFLIGPVTGLAGIFLGPFYYFLIAPFYLIGGGDPVVPAILLALLTTAAISITYYLGWRMHSRVAGVVVAGIVSFSYYLVLAGRWLANPTPMMLTSVILLLAMYKITAGGSKKWWYLVFLTAGISLHFESASAFFYIPMIGTFLLWIKLRFSSYFPSKKILLLSGVLFALTLLPQVVFNFKHENILFNNFQKVIFEEKSFRSPLGENLTIKKNFFWGVFTSKLFPTTGEVDKIFYFTSLIGLLFYFKKHKKEIVLFAIFLGIPALGYVFFQGNFGNMYDYYLTGYYFPMFLLFAIGLSEFWKSAFGKFIVVWFFIVFLNNNLVLVKNNITAGVDGPTHVSLGNQIQGVDWIIKNHLTIKSSGEFNADVYVPPVIPYTYDYLFLWQGNKKCGVNLCGLVKDKNVKDLYVLYEQDPPHPERLKAWLDNESKSGIVEKVATFGGVTVEKRNRL